MLLFERIFSLLSGFNCIWTAYWTAYELLWWINGLSSHVRPFFPDPDCYWGAGSRRDQRWWWPSWSLSINGRVAGQLGAAQPSSHHHHCSLLYSVTIITALSSTVLPSSLYLRSAEILPHIGRNCPSLLYIVQLPLSHVSQTLGQHYENYKGLNYFFRGAHLS
jgi:hypothetical protein